MPSAVFVPNKIGAGDYVDVPAYSAGDNGKALTYNHGTGVFVYTAFEAAGAVAAHVALADPHSQYELESNNTAAAILAKILTVDGSGSGLDADLLDGQSSAAFAASSHAHDHGALTGLADDDHTQYLLASGSRNGAATIVASSAGSTPLTLKMAASQTADGLMAVDSANGQLVRIDKRGRIGTGANVTFDYLYSAGYGYSVQLDSNITVSDLTTPYTRTEPTALQALLAVDDRHTTGQPNLSAYGIYGATRIASTCTYVPTSAYGLYFATFNDTDSDIGQNGIFVTVGANGTGGSTSYVVGGYFESYVYGNSSYLAAAEFYSDNYGAGTASYVAGIYIYAGGSGTITEYCGIEIENVASTAATAYAIRTQGGQVLHQAGASATVPFVAQGAASQTVNLTQWKNSAGTVLSAITKDGYLAAAQTAATAVVDVAASTTSRASIRIRSGTAPSSPNDGDLWYDGTNLKFRVGGTTKTFTLI